MARMLLTHGTVVTMDAERRIIPDGAVLIEAGRIVRADRASAFDPNALGDVKVVDCSGKLILPGFIDAHAHAGHTMNRALGWDTRSFWMAYMEKIYHHHTTPGYWYAEGRLAALERLKAGITLGVSVLTNAQRADDPRIAVENSRGYGAVGNRQIVAVGPSNPPYPHGFHQYREGRWESVSLTFDEIMTKTEEAIELVNGTFDGRIQAFIAPFVLVGSVEPSGPTPADRAVKLTDLDRKMMRAVREIASRQKTRIHTEAFGGMIRLAKQSDDALLGPDVHLQHCKGISFDEALILAETGTHVTTTPAWGQYVTRCPVPELLGLGVNVAATTDGVAPGIPYDLIQAVRNLAMIQQGALNDFYYLPPGKMLSMITIDAARAVGREHDLGSIEPGKLADLITVDMRQPHLAPTHLPVHTLMLYGNAADVADVMVEGRWVMRGRQVLTVDEAEVLRDAAEESSAAIRRAGLEKLLKPSDTFWDYRNHVFEPRLP